MKKILLSATIVFFAISTTACSSEKKPKQTKKTTKQTQTKNSPDKVQHTVEGYKEVQKDMRQLNDKLKKKATQSEKKINDLLKGI